MRSARRYRILPVLCALAVVQCSPKESTDSAASESVKVEGLDPSSRGEATLTQHLSHIRVVESADLAVDTPDSQATVETALLRAGAFRRDPKSKGCRAEVGVFYAISKNGKLVKSAEVGTALVGVEAMVHCPRSDAYETFRVELKDSKDFKNMSPERLGAVFEGLLKQVARDATDQLVGQIIVRPLPDEQLLTILRKQEGEGKLMEAAIEAGERRLHEAIPDLIRLTRHESGVVRLRAAAALGLLKVSDEAVIRALARLTEGSNREQIVVAVAALSDIGGPKALRYLDNIGVSHPEEVVRALARAGAEKVKRLGPADGVR